MAIPGRRVYIGHLAPDATKQEVERYFGEYGKILDVRVMTGFGFIEYENVRDAEDVVHDFNGRTFLGEKIIVEFAKAPRDPYGSNGGGREPARRPAPRLGGGGHRLLVSNLPPEVSWQDLKDIARSAGNVIFADVVRDRPGEGIIEYSSRLDADEAVRRLDGSDVRGTRIRIAEDTGRGDRDFRDRDRDRRYRDRDDDDHYSSRRGGGGGGRNRSLSPRRGGGRSPPPRALSPDDRDKYSAGGSRRRSPPPRRRSPNGY